MERQSMNDENSEDFDDDSPPVWKGLKIRTDIVPEEKSSSQKAFDSWKLDELPVVTRRKDDFPSDSGVLINRTGRRNSFSVYPGDFGPVSVVSQAEAVPEAQGDRPLSPPKEELPAILSPDIHHWVEEKDSVLFHGTGAPADSGVTIERIDSVTLPKGKDEAIATIDHLIETCLVSYRAANDFNNSLYLFAQCLSTISAYMRSTYRYGIFLAPFPSGDILDRLRLCCSYFFASRIMLRVSKQQGDVRQQLGSLVLVLRVPLMKEDVISTSKRVAELFAVVGDVVGEMCVLERCIDTLRETLNLEELEAASNRLLVLKSLIDPREMRPTRLQCPLCKERFSDISQKACLRGCGTKFTPDFWKGVLAPIDDCVRCSICNSTYSIASGRDPNFKSVRMVHKQEIPQTCLLCQCTGALRPLHLT